MTQSRDFIPNLRDKHCYVTIMVIPFPLSMVVFSNEAGCNSGRKSGGFLRKISSQERQREDAASAAVLFLGVAWNTTASSGVATSWGNASVSLHLWGSLLRTSITERIRVLDELIELPS